MNGSILQNLVIFMSLACNHDNILGRSMSQCKVNGFPSVGQAENLFACRHILQSRKDFVNDALRVLGAGIVASNHNLVSRP